VNTDCGTLKGVQHILDVGQWVPVLHSHLVKHPEVNTQPQGTPRFSSKEDRGPIRGRRFPNPTFRQKFCYLFEALLLLSNRQPIHFIELGLMRHSGTSFKRVLKLVPHTSLHRLKQSPVLLEDVDKGGRKASMTKHVLNAINNPRRGWRGQQHPQPTIRWDRWRWEHRVSLPTNDSIALMPTFLAPHRARMHRSRQHTGRWLMR
jgi:hypothetical protein